MGIKNKVKDFYWNRWEFFSFLEDIPDKILGIFGNKFIRFFFNGIVFMISYLIYIGLTTNDPTEKVTELAFANVVVLTMLLFFGK